MLGSAHSWHSDLVDLGEVISQHLLHLTVRLRLLL